MQEQKFCGSEFALVNNLSSFQLDMSKDHRSLCFCLNINSSVVLLQEVAERQYNLDLNYT